MKLDSAPSSMRALRLYPPQSDLGPIANSQRSPHASKTWEQTELRLEEIPKPTAQNQELLLKVQYCGICGSDFHLSTNANESLAYPGLLQLPVTIGHEFSAIVDQHGPLLKPQEKEAFPLGAPVTCEEMLWCGHCNNCRAGFLNHCLNLEEIGFTVDGAQSEFLSVPMQYCWSLLELAEKFGLEKSLQMGALVEPYAVAYRGLFQGAHANIWQPGGKVLIFGAGPIGLASLDLALAAGAAEVAVIEPLQERRELAKALGASLQIGTYSLPELITIIQGWSKGTGVDWVIDAAGTTFEASQLAQEVLGVGGTLSLLARTDEDGKLNSERMITKNIRILGSQGHSGQQAFPRVISLMAHERIHPLQLIQDIISLEETQERLLQQQKSAGKILVQPWKTTSHDH